MVVPDRPGWQIRISPALVGPDGRLVEGVVQGGGVFVGGRWVMTCAHVVGSPDSRVLVRFSFCDGDPIEATVKGWVSEDEGDFTLLMLDREPPRGVCAAPLRSGRSVVGEQGWCYGYPQGLDGGVGSGPLIEGTVGAPVGPGQWLQLTAQVAHGHRVVKGFSGSGLWDTRTGAVVGLVVARDRTPEVLGGFAIPLWLATAAFPQLAPWVGWRLSTDPGLRQHWRPRARGVWQDTTRGWYFTGRARLLRELVGWWHDPNPADGRVRVVTGPAGTGKSAVLAWLTALSDPGLRAQITTERPDVLTDPASLPELGVVSAAVWVRNLDMNGAAGALADALSLRPASPTPEDVCAAIDGLDRVERDRLVLVVDALDEAHLPAQLARKLLVPLARDLHVKVLVGSRPGRGDDLIGALADPVTYRLDDPVFFDRADLVSYAAASLRLDHDPTASSGYRTQAAATAAVAEAITDAAGTSFLVTGMAARARSRAVVIDTSIPGWQSEQRFPRDAGEALEDYLDRFGPDRTRAVDLLRALAYAEGTGLPASELWTTVAGALNPPRRYSPSDDLAWLLDRAADYLIETATAPDPSAYRLFHQALNDHLRPPATELAAQQRLTQALLTTVPTDRTSRNWARADRYVHRHLASHASVAHQLDDLLTDPGYLCHADLGALLRALPAARSDTARSTAALIRSTAHHITDAPPAQRASTLELAAHLAGLPGHAATIAAAAPTRSWRTVWTRGGNGLSDHQVLPHEGPLSAVAVGALPDGTPVVVSGGYDGTVRLWRLSDGHPIGEPLTGHVGWVWAVAVGALPDGTPVVVSGGVDATVRRWRLSDGHPIGAPLTGHEGGVSAVAVGALPDGTPVVVSGDDGTVRLWRLSDGHPIGAPLTGHVGGVRAVAVGALPDGTPVVVSGGGDGDGTVRLWRLSDGHPIGAPLTGHEGWVWAVAVGALPDGTPVVVSGGEDGTVRLWRLSDGHPIGAPLTGHVGGVRAVAVGALPDGTPVVVSGDDGTVRLWRLSDGHPIGEPLTGHRSGVNAVAVGALPDGTPIVVSGGEDGTVLSWQPDRGPDPAVLGVGGQVQALAVTFGGHVVISTVALIVAHLAA